MEQNFNPGLALIGLSGTGPMFIARAWPQQCRKSCANGSNVVALRFGDQGIKEMLGVVGLKV